MNKQKILISAAIASATFLGLAAVALTIDKPRRAWECGKQNEGGFYILKSGDEFIEAYPGKTYSVNSQLISNTAPSMPKRWKPENIKTDPVINDEGFEYTSVYTYEGDETRYKTIFSAPKNLHTRRQVDSKEAPNSTKCIPIPWDEAASELQGRLTGVPVEYLIARSKLVEAINPKLGSQELNTKLANTLLDTNGADYSIYKLLSALDRNKLTTDQLDTIDQSKKKLLDSSSQESTIWEHSGRFVYYSSHENEQQASNRCNSVSSNLYSYTSQGYEIASSNPEVKEMGWGLKCQGTFYLLKKAGYID